MIIFSVLAQCVVFCVGPKLDPELFKQQMLSLVIFGGYEGVDIS